MCTWTYNNYYFLFERVLTYKNYSQIDCHLYVLEILESFVIASKVITLQQVH